MKKYYEENQSKNNNLRKGAAEHYIHFNRLLLHSRRDFIDIDYNSVRLKDLSARRMNGFI